MQSNYKSLHDKYENLKLMYLRLLSKEERPENIHAAESCLPSRDALRTGVGEQQSLD